MTEFETLVVSIEKHSQRLIQQKSALMDENKELKKEIENLKLLVKQNESLLIELKKKNELKIAETLEGGDRSSMTSKKIDELVREIDKCITLLNR